MQRMNLPVENIDEPTIPRPSEGSPPRPNGTTETVPNGAASVDMSRSYSLEKGKRFKRFQGEICVHSIPVILILCYLCLWVASSEIPRFEDRTTLLHRTLAIPAPLVLSGTQVEAPAQGNGFFIDDNHNVNASEEPV